MLIEKNTNQFQEPKHMMDNTKLLYNLIRLLLSIIMLCPFAGFSQVHRTSETIGSFPVFLDHDTVLHEMGFTKTYEFHDNVLTTTVTNENGHVTRTGMFYKGTGFSLEYNTDGEIWRREFYRRYKSRYISKEN